MKIISDKSFREDEDTHILFNKSVPENRAVYDIMWRNMVVPERPNDTTDKMRFSFRKAKTSIQSHIHNKEYSLIFKKN